MDLYTACKNGHIDIVKLIFERDIIKGTYELDFALEYACKGGHIDIVRLLIEKGARKWNYAFQQACKSGYMEIVNLMIETSISEVNKNINPIVAYKFKPRMKSIIQCQLNIIMQKHKQKQLYIKILLFHYIPTVLIDCTILLLTITNTSQFTR